MEISKELGNTEGDSEKNLEKNTEQEENVSPSKNGKVKNETSPEEIKDMRNGSLKENDKDEVVVPDMSNGVEPHNEATKNHNEKTLQENDKKVSEVAEKSNGTKECKESETGGSKEAGDVHEQDNEGHEMQDSLQSLIHFGSSAIQSLGNATISLARFSWRHFSNAWQGSRFQNLVNTSAHRVFMTMWSYVLWPVLKVLGQMFFIYICLVIVCVEYITQPGGSSIISETRQLNSRSN